MHPAPGGACAAGRWPHAATGNYYLSARSGYTSSIVLNAR